MPTLHPMSHQTFMGQFSLADLGVYGMEETREARMEPQLRGEMFVQ